jgi:hypothetical protein
MGHPVGAAMRRRGGAYTERGANVRARPLTRWAARCTVTACDRGVDGGETEKDAGGIR